LKVGLTDETTNLLNCSLETFSIDWLPAYYALSYCWGSLGRTAQISCNNEPLTISPTLLNGLAALESHLETSRQYLWIDQICINQDDLEERAYQVTLMQDIYSQAEKVIVWLDIPDNSPENDAGFRLAQLICNSAAMPPNERGRLEILDEIGSMVSKTEAPNLVSFGLPPISDHSWRELSTILNHPWFCRVWVIQEVVLAKSDPLVIYGSKFRSWQSLMFTGAWISQLGAGFAQSINLSGYNAIAFKFLHRICLSKDTMDSFGALETDQLRHGYRPKG
jgi:hypothetical protein